MARLISHQLLTPAPWKNGGGSTTELAVFPRGAGFDDFDWRISLASISRSGPFSVFPGIDRSLALVDGAGLLLRIDGQAERRLDGAAPLVRFAGEAQVHAEILAASTDFNVMTRRGLCRHALRALAAPARLERRGAATLVFLAAGGPVTLGRQFRLGRYDALLLEAGDASSWSIDTDGAPGAAGSVLVAELFYDEAI